MYTRVDKYMCLPVNTDSCPRTCEVVCMNAQACLNTYLLDLTSVNICPGINVLYVCCCSVGICTCT